MEYTVINEVKIEDIKSRFKNKREYSVIIPYSSKESDVLLSHILRAVLDDLNQENMFIHLEYVINEFVMNASKANSKRLYFKSIGLDINNDNDYAKGIGNFKADVLKDFTNFEKFHIEGKSFVNINFKTDDKALNIRFLNNSPLTNIEKNNIKERFQKAKGFEDMTDVFSHTFDNSEGQGYGLTIIMLMLRKLNLNESAITYKNEGNCCITSLKIPLSILSKEHGKIIASEIATEIDQMPQFPESILSLQKELSDPNCSFASISKRINADPALTAEILRIANSPVYRSRNEITDVQGAVRMMGMLGVRSVLYNYGVNKVMNNKYDKSVIKEVNEHSYYVARVASFMASYKNLGKVGEDIYVAALLHDIGKIIINSMYKDLEIKLKDLCTRKYIPISILEDLTKGYNHSLVGSEIAEKWNFPEKYISAIAYHHTPLEVNDEYKPIIYSIYLGDEIFYYNNNEREFSDMNYIVLEYFGLEEEEHFEEFLKAIKIEGLIE